MNEIQDYLDGRLSEKERAAFEERMAREPDLARRVEAYRGIGHALREEPEALSPGFYTRARARFEEASARPHRFWRLLSWEAAGLAAAVILAAAVFLPGLLRRDRTLAPPEPPGRQVEASRADDDSAAGEKSATEKKEIAEDLRVADEVAAAPVEEAATEGFAPAPQQEKNKPDVESQVVGRVLADAPAAEPEAAPSAGRGFVAEFEEASPAHEIVTLGPGALEPGTVRVVSEQAWREQKQSKDQLLQKKRSAASLSEADVAGARRVVLIGSRDGLTDCSKISVEILSDAYLVRIPSGAGQAGPDCAVMLPLDDREIRVPEPGGG